jgi:aminoglycoside phosphotransferase (APT) family kinase protein
MDERVVSAVERAFPDRGVAEIGAAGPSWNPTNDTAAVAFADGGRAYVKIALDGDPSRIERERAVLAYVRERLDVPVPRIVGSDTADDPPYLATAPLAGENLAAGWSNWSGDDRERVAREFGAALARVHGERFNSHGHVTGGDADALTLDPGPWTEVLVDTIERLRRTAPSDRFDERFDEVIATVQERRSLLDDTPAVLLHGDPAKPNAFRCGGRVGFVDWEIAHVGDPAREVYRGRNQALDSLRESAPERIVTAYRDGYRSVARSLPEGYERRRPIYAAVRFLGVAGFYERVASYLDDPEEAVAAWIDAEMDRRLAAVRDPSRR